MGTQASQVGKIEATTTTVTTATVTKIGGYNVNRVMAILSNETASDFFYAFGDNNSVIGDFSTANMLILRANTDQYFYDGVGTGPLFVYHAAGADRDIKTFLD